MPNSYTEHLLNILGSVHENSSKFAEGIKNSSENELQFELTASSQSENEPEKELDKD